MKNSSQIKYHFKIHKEENSFWAECIELPSCLTEADTRETLFINMKEALDLFFEDLENSDYLPPLPNLNIAKTNTIVEVAIEPEIAQTLDFKHLTKKMILNRNLPKKRPLTCYPPELEVGVMSVCEPSNPLPSNSEELCYTS